MPTKRRTTTDTTAQATLRVRGPADIVAAIPYLIGFHPARSVVVMGLDPQRNGRVVVTARIDIDDVADSPATLDHTMNGIARSTATRVLVAVFDDGARPDPAELEHRGVAGLPWAGLAREIEQSAGDRGLEVEEMLLVVAGRSWSYQCDDPSCCPPEGRVLESSSVPAECTYAGLVALPDRAALEATLDPLPDEERDRLLFALDLAEYDAVGVILGGADARLDRSVKRALFAAARAADGNPAATPSDERVVQFGSALQRPSVRDAVWLAVDGGRLDGRRLWRDLARRLPAPYDASALFLYGWASYRAGNGALAGIAAERALASDPACYAADLLLSALSRAIDPHTLPRLRRPRSA